MSQKISDSYLTFQHSYFSFWILKSPDITEKQFLIFEYAGNFCTYLKNLNLKNDKTKNNLIVIQFIIAIATSKWWDYL